jgi:hypothetical protein
MLKLHIISSESAARWRATVFTLFLCFPSIVQGEWKTVNWRRKEWKVGKLEWKFITPWNCTPTRLVLLLKNLWSQTWDLREVAEGGRSCEFKSPCQRKPCLSYCLRQNALQCCGSAKVVETLKQSTSSQGNTRVFLLLSEKILMGKREGITLCLTARLFKCWSKNKQKKKKCFCLSLRPVVFCGSGDETPHNPFFALDLVGLL